MNSLLSLIAGVATLITALGALVAALQNGKHIGQTQGKVDDVHVLVNSNMDELVARVRQLTDSLEHSDTAVPPTPPRSK